MKCLFKDIRSALTPFLPLLCTCVYIKTRVWKLADRYKCSQPIGEILPTPSLSFCSGGWTADYEVVYEIRWVIVNSGKGSHTPCFSLNNTVSGTFISQVKVFGMEMERDSVNLSKWWPLLTIQPLFILWIWVTILISKSSMVAFFILWYVTVY